MTQDLLRPYLNKPLAEGWNPFLENDPESQMDFGIVRINQGKSHTFQSETQESALLVLEGKGVIHFQGIETSFDRNSWIDQLPWTVHAPCGETITVTADAPTEIAVTYTPNPDSFEPHLYPPDEVEVEHRGEGILDNAAHRVVRTIFDRRNAPEKARLVLGEVLNFPGRWSSYPPHHHPQPELYYYRFSPEWGYGHGELGETIVKLRHHDLLRIAGEQDHPQCAAPGIFMYYLWAIRHLPNDPYLGFEYTKPFEDLLR
ncbi:MAG: 5-deoxy-glucuronate isomerase [bacterium]